MKLIVSFSCSICGRLPFIFLNLTQNRFLGSVQLRTNLVDIFMVNEREANSCPRDIKEWLTVPSSVPIDTLSLWKHNGFLTKVREMCYMIGEWFGMIQSFAWPLFMCLPYVCYFVSFDFICSIGRNLELILIYSSWNVELKNHWFFFHRKLYLQGSPQLSTYIFPTKKLSLRQVRLLASDHLTETGSGARVCSDV